MPNPDQLLKLSKIFNISIDELMDNKDFIYDRNIKKEVFKKEKNEIKQYKKAMILSFIASLLSFLDGIIWFIAYYFIKEQVRLALGFVFIGIAILSFGIAFMYKKKYVN